MGSTEKKNRIYWWDNIKVCLMLLVVIGHFLIQLRLQYHGSAVQAVYLWIYSFHMPAFIFVSGYFAKSFVRRDRFDYNRLIGFAALFFLFKVACWAVDCLWANSPPVFTFFSEKSAPWYILCLFWWYLMLPFFCKFRGVCSIGFAVLLSLLVGLDGEVNSFLAAGQAVTFFPFFLLGYYFPEEPVLRKHPVLYSRWLQILCLIGLAASLLLYWKKIGFFLKYERLVYGHSSYASMGFSGAEGVVYKAAFLLTAAALMFLLFFAMPRNRTFFSGAGAMTLGVYVFHRLIRPAVMHYHILDHFSKTSLELLIATTILSIIVLAIFSAGPFTALLNRVLRHRYIKDD